jgi:hypothetical protein
MDNNIDTGAATVKTEAHPGAEVILNNSPNRVQSNVRSWQEYRELINKAWAKGPAAYIETAERLVEAKAELARDVFESLTKLNQLNFDSSVSRKLLCIGKNRVLCCAPGHKLPAGWTIAYELSKVKDDVLKAALADGRINPRMKRKDAVELHTPAKPKLPTTPPTETDYLHEVWGAATDEEQAKIVQGEPVDRLVSLMCDAQRAEVFDKVVSLQIAQALPVPATQNSKKLLTNLTGTFHWGIGQDDPANRAQCLKFIAAKLRANKRSAKDICFAFTKPTRR